MAEVQSKSGETIHLRPPSATDGYAVSRLIARCPPLDPNSTYCNLLQCDHFAQTCVIATMGEQVVGFASGYRIPSRADTLFVWQVAVDVPARGCGLATKLVHHILARPELADVQFIETTVTPGNRASEALFERLAAHLDAELNKSVQYGRDSHFDGQHDDEILHRIGPFSLID